jgi:hypothetical protein
MTFTLHDIASSKVAGINAHLFDQPKKKSKYGNKGVEIDGIYFRSAKEAKRYGILKLRLKSGEIGLLQTQVPYELNEGGTHSLKYYADFVYIETATGETVVEDTKGCKTKLYKKKKKLMKKIYNIEIKEV